MGNTLYTQNEKGLITATLQTNLSAAFDTVDTKILLDKLEHYGVRGDTLELFTSYLTQRTQYVEIDTHTSNTLKSPQCSVIQGSKLSGTLYTTFGNHGCSGCSTGFNHSSISPKLYLRKSGLQWLLNRFQPFLDLSQTIPSEIRVAVVAQPVSTNLGSLHNYTFGNQGCSGCSTGFNHSWISPKLYLRKSGLQWLLNRFQPKKKFGYTFENQGCSGC